MGILKVFLLIFWAQGAESNSWTDSSLSTELLSPLESNKPLYITQESPPKAQVSKEDENLAKASQACHLQKHLGAHTNYIRQQVFPRIQAELQLLLLPRIHPSGQTFYVTENIDYGDLFHAHIRNPLFIVPYQATSLDEQFTQSSDYHLQYHSYEFHDYLHIRWLQELQTVAHPPLQEWLEKRLAHIGIHNANSWGHSDSSPRSLVYSPLEPLEESVRLEFAKQWHLSLKEKSPGMTQLEQKLRSLDPKDLKLGTSIFSYRSVVSTDERFLVIRPLDLKDHWQPATVYFEEISESSEVAQVIQKAKAAGLTHLINTQSQYFRREAFPANTPWDLHTQLSQELMEAAVLQTQKDPLYMFGHSFKSRADRLSHVVIGWSEELLFSIRYFIPCSEKEQSVAATLQKAQTFQVVQP